ncbi:hypothetical protein SDC9_54438 [bioreactor metagenome]|uniref:Uncharacterized protein n=1 Tax=bioreactor metagenome TaxID=1076179 RepID=A0A644WW22_9ZZZZ
MYLRHVGCEPLPKRRVFRLAHQLGIGFLKHLRVNALTAVLMAVLVNFVDKKQREHLDSLIGISKLLIQVCLNRPADLRTFDDVLIHVADCFTEFYFFCVPKLDMLIFRRAVDSDYRIALVQVSFAGKQKQIVARLDGNGFT